MENLNLVLLLIMLIFSIFLNMVVIEISNKYDVFYFSAFSSCVTIIILEMYMNYISATFYSEVSRVEWNEFLRTLNAAFIFMYINRIYKNSDRRKFLIFVQPILQIIYIVAYDYFNFRMNDNKFLNFIYDVIFNENFIWYILVIAIVCALIIKENNSNKWVDTENGRIKLAVTMTPMVGIGLDIVFGDSFNIITPILFLITEIIFIVTIEKHNIISQISFLRENLVSEIKEAFIILDRYFIVKDYNEQSTQIFKNLDGTNVNFHVSEIEGLPWEEIEKSNKEYYEFSMENETAVKYYRAKVFDLMKKDIVYGYSVFVYDITQLKMATKELEYLSITDKLTDLYNRRYFFDTSVKLIDDALRWQVPLCVIMVDIDHFKNINDTYGHQVGDKVLSNVAHIMKDICNDLGIVARYGGEEFSIILENHDIYGGFLVAEEIRKAVENSCIETEKGTVKVTISIGLSELNLNKGTNINKVIVRSDDALYYAKRNGRNRTVAFDVDGNIVNFNEG